MPVGALRNTLAAGPAQAREIVEIASVRNSFNLTNRSAEPLLDLTDEAYAALSDAAV